MPKLIVTSSNDEFFLLDDRYHFTLMNDGGTTILPCRENYDDQLIGHLGHWISGAKILFFGSGKNTVHISGVK
jgi:hypothetical protein